MAPVAAEPPHAWVVDYRPLDACSPPACAIATRSLVGDANAAEPDGRPGGWTRFGTDAHELFARRAVVVAPGGAWSFAIGPAAGDRALDAYLACARPDGGAWSAAIDVEPGGAAWRLEGRTDRFVARDDEAELGAEDRYFVHVRRAFGPPARTGAGASPERVEVRVRNTGDCPLSVGSPLVMRREPGRAARQAVFVFFDAVPWPLLDRLFRGSGDPATEWVASFVARGTLFARGISPGQLTGSFVRRFMKGEFWAMDGDPSLRGQGFDERPPARAPGPVARLAEQGFSTQAIGSNLYLSPVLSHLAFDGVWNVESTLPLQAHPPAVARRFAAWVAEHPDDDAFAVVWFASTHAPWRPGRTSAPPVEVPGLGAADVDRGVLVPVWRNLLEAADALATMRAAAARSPGARRLWFVGTDHGHTFTAAARARPWRLPRESVASEHRHCCLSTLEETRTPFAIVDEPPGAGAGVEAPGGGAGRIVEEPTSAMAVWRAVEDAFGVSLGLPDARSFDAPALGGGRDRWAARFDDGAIVSVGNSGSIALVAGRWAYRSYAPRLDLDSIWSVGPAVARMLGGTPSRAGDLVAEELYDLETDPLERANVGWERFDALLDARRRAAEWMSAHAADPPDHPRHRFVLRFAARTAIEVEAARPLRIVADGARVEGPSSRRVRIEATRIEIEDGDRPVGVVDVRGATVASGLVVRCAASGLPVAFLGPDRARLDLQTARANCPPGPAGPAGVAETSPPPGEVAIETAVIGGGPAPAASARPLGALEEALRRWGYVRDRPR